MQAQFLARIMQSCQLILANSTLRTGHT